MGLIMSISLIEVKKFANEWFHTVANGGTGDDQAKFHLHRDARIFTGDGVSFTLDEHHKLHQQWINEKHVFGPLELTKIHDNPERVRINGTVYWEATQRAESQSLIIIKMIVGETWYIEKTSRGLRFVLYISGPFHPLPDSSPLNL